MTRRLLGPSALLAALACAGCSPGGPDEKAVDRTKKVASMLGAAKSRRQIGEMLKRQAGGLPEPPETPPGATASKARRPKKPR